MRIQVCVFSWTATEGAITSASLNLMSRALFRQLTESIWSLWKDSPSCKSNLPWTKPTQEIHMRKACTLRPWRPQILKNRKRFALLQNSIISLVYNRSDVNKQVEKPYAKPSVLSLPTIFLQMTWDWASLCVPTLLEMYLASSETKLFGLRAYYYVGYLCKKAFLFVTPCIDSLCTVGSDFFVSGRPAFFSSLMASKMLNWVLRV